jgi:hypothetical protein
MKFMWFLYEPMKFDKFVMYAFTMLILFTLIHQFLIVMGLVYDFY